MKLDDLKEVEELDAQKLWNMELHEEVGQNGYVILRVPGGWIYNLPAGNVFVPYSEEGCQYEGEDEEWEEEY